MSGVRNLFRHSRLNFKLNQSMRTVNVLCFDASGNTFDGN